MNVLNQKMKFLFKRWRTAGFLHLAYALLAEALLIAAIVFAALFTIETLLPTFISVRLSLSVFFATILLGTLALSLLGRYLDIDAVSGLRLRNPIVWLGIVWSTSILAISLSKFPPLLIPIIILAFFGIGYLFLSLFFSEED